MPTLVLKHGESSGSMRLGEILRDHAHRLKVIELHRGEQLPPDLDDVYGIVSCGGGASPLDETLEWIEPEKQLLREAHEIGIPIVGLCLGCQLLADALGGTVGKIENGPEVGWHDVKLTPVGREDPLHAGIGWTTKQAHWHSYEVKQLPSDARLLASSEKCKVQTWSLGLTTYGFQYHPEIWPHTFAEWTRDEPQTLEAAGLALDELNHQSKEHYAAFERITTRLFESIALLLMPVDRRYQGLVKDLHH